MYFHTGGGKLLPPEIHLWQDGKVKIKQGVVEIKEYGFKVHETPIYRVNELLEE
jgi:hypothetical protein